MKFSFSIFIRSIALAAVALYLFILAGVYVFEDRLVFERKTSDPLFSNCEVLLSRGAEARTTDFGARVYLKKSPQAVASILYFHGNVSGACHYSDHFEALSRMPFHLAFVEYPGYAGDSQIPTEKQILSEALKLYDWLEKEEGLPVIPFGHSLGTGPATYLASKRPVKALVLRAPYDALSSVAKFRYPFLPIDWLMRNTFKAYAWAAEVKSPVLILRADMDQTIPPQITDREIAAFRASKPQVIEFKGASHNSMNKDAPELYWGSVETFIKASL